VSARQRWLALGVLCLSLLAIVIDNTIVNVALPTLVHDLDADVSQLQWVVDAYTLVFAALLLLAGALGDRFGRRRTLLGGLAVFGIASGCAAYAGGVDGLIVARAVMGAGAAFIMPATLSLLISVFTDARERAMAIGLWAATAGLGVALGPVVGGILLDHFWWGSIFIVNVPLAAIAVAAGSRLIPESRDPVARRLDWTGAALSGAGLVTLVWAIIEAPSRGWMSTPVLGTGALAMITLAAFIVWQRRVEEPLLDVRLFDDARFTAASGTIMVLFFAPFGFLFLSTQYLQFVLGYGPSAAGVGVLPYAGAMIVSALVSSHLVVRFGTKGVVTAGMALLTTRPVSSAEHSASPSSAASCPRSTRHTSPTRCPTTCLRPWPRRLASRSAPPSKPAAPYAPTLPTPRVRRSCTPCRGPRSPSPSWPHWAPSSPGARSHHRPVPTQR
jgi:EmrB/QacA subfamily drug resistance transporter